MSEFRYVGPGCPASDGQTRSTVRVALPRRESLAVAVLPCALVPPLSHGTRDGAHPGSVWDAKETMRVSDRHT